MFHFFFQFLMFHDDVNSERWVVNISIVSICFEGSTRTRSTFKVDIDVNELKIHTHTHQVYPTHYTQLERTDKDSVRSEIDLCAAYVCRAP